MSAVLLAEDEEHIAKLVEFKLRKEGFEVTWAQNGRDAIALLPTRAWSLAILDVMMPFADGWEVLRAARSALGSQALPVLMLTAKGFDQEKANAAALGATQFLRKPFDPAELARLVREMTGAKP